MTKEEQKFVRYLGLCRRAGGVIRGGDTILRAVRSENPARRPALVLIASNASERTVKQLADKCRYYSVPFYKCAADSFRLAEITGHTSPCAALGFLAGRGPIEALTAVCAAEDREKNNTNGIEEANIEAKLLRKDDGEWQ